ncbi:MAG: hypothetical protein H9W81_05085 [Enterococcus sp.]|nr:hypothetical protein [Enterococcus sp.]
MTKVLDSIVSPKSSRKWMKSLGVATLSSAGAGALIFKVNKVRERRDANAVFRQNIIARHNTLQKEWENFLANPDRVLDNPALNDRNHPVHGAVFEAMRRARMFRVHFATEKVKDVRESSFARAVEYAEYRWKQAQQMSQEIGVKDLDEEKLKHLKKAKTQWRAIKNSQKTPAEKKRAYTAFTREIKEVMHLSEVTDKAIREHLK